MTGIQRTPVATGPLFLDDHLGACRGAPADWWFPIRGEDAGVGQEICRGCPVIRGCLNYALDHPKETEYGTWGGIGPTERRRIRAGRGDGIPPPTAQIRLEAFLSQRPGRWFKVPVMATVLELHPRSIQRALWCLLEDGKVEMRAVPNVQGGMKEWRFIGREPSVIR